MIRERANCHHDGVLRPNAAGWTAVTGAGQAALTALAVPLNAWFVSAFGVLYDLRGFPAGPGWIRAWTVPGARRAMLLCGLGCRSWTRIWNSCRRGRGRTRCWRWPTTRGCSSRWWASRRRGSPRRMCWGSSPRSTPAPRLAVAAGRRSRSGRRTHERPLSSGTPRRASLLRSPATRSGRSSSMSLPRMEGLASHRTCV